MVTIVYYHTYQISIKKQELHSPVFPASARLCFRQKAAPVFLLRAGNFSERRWGHCLPSTTS